MTENLERIGVSWDRDMLFRVEVQQAEELLRQDLGVGGKIDDPADKSVDEREIRQRRLGRLEALQWVLGQENGMTDEYGRLTMDQFTGARYMRERMRPSVMFFDPDGIMFERGSRGV